MTDFYTVHLDANWFVGKTLGPMGKIPLETIQGVIGNNTVDLAGQPHTAS